MNATQTQKPDMNGCHFYKNGAGIGLACMAAAKGYKLKCVMPEVSSLERRVVMLALGAELYITSKEAGFDVRLLLSKSLDGYLSSFVSSNGYVPPEVYVCL